MRLSDLHIDSVLIVDTPTEAAAARDLLVQGGLPPASVESVTSYAEALQRLSQQEYTLCLAAVQLADGSGSDLLREARNAGWGGAGILMTPSDDSAQSDSALHDGADGDLAKDRMTSSALERAVRHALDRRRSHEAIVFQASILDSVGQAVIAMDTDGRILFWNPVAESIFGWQKSEILGRSIIPLLEARETEEEVAAILAVLREGRTWSGETDARRKDGSRIPIAVIYSPIQSGETLRGVIAVCSDITEQRRARETLRLLSNVSAAVASSLDFNETLERVASLVVPALGESCAVHLRTPDDTLQLVAFAQEDARRRDMTMELMRRHPPRLEDSSLLGRAILSGEPVMLSRFDTYVQEVELSPRGRELLQQLAPRSVLVMPLIGSNGDRLGALTLATSTSGRRYTEADLPLARELASRASQAIDNSRLYEQERQARKAAQAAAERTERLQRVTEALTRAVTVQQVADVMMSVALPSVGTVRGALSLVDETGETLIWIAARGYSTDVVEQWRRVPLSADNPATVAVRTGECIYVGSPAEMRRRFSQPFVIGQSWAALPLITDSGTVGAFTMGFDTVSAFGDSERSFMVLLAGQCAQALARARLFEAERRARIALAETQRIARIGSWEYHVEQDEMLWTDELWRMAGMEPGSMRLNRASWVQMIHPDDRAEEMRKLEHLLRSGERHEYLHRLIRPDGQMRWIRGSREVHRGSTGRVERLYGYVQDVTDQHSLEEQFLQAQKMEAVGQLAGGVAHDFNNLLTVILSYSDLIRDAVPDTDPVRLDVEEIRRAAQRATDLTRQLLAFSRRQILRVTSFNLNTVLAEMRQLLERLLGEDIVLTFTLDEQLPPVRADRSQIEQVVMNLVLNSRDAMPHGGTIFVETRSVPTDGGRPRVLLAVRDTGMGMDATTQSRIFEPFFTTKEIGRGTGLGLSTVRGIVEQSGGDITVESAPGKGTVMRIYLPGSTARPSEDRESVVVPEAVGGHETILLVEDERGVRDVLRRLLEGFGYRVIEATNGAEALHLARAHREEIDLLLTDVVMPGVSGFDLAELLEEAGIQLPVIFMSGYAEDEINRRSSAPVRDLLAKPFSHQDLAARVRAALDGAGRGARATA